MILKDWKDCRNCNCPDWAHFRNDITTCGNYIPKDNLEYLEWCLDKKKEITK